MTRRIAMWSGPRNLSTAMMRSFESRSDTFVSDEPFYGCFLKSTGADHPMLDEVIAAMDCDWESVMRALGGEPPDGSSSARLPIAWCGMARPGRYSCESAISPAHRWLPHGSPWRWTLAANIAPQPVECPS